MSTAGTRLKGVVHGNMIVLEHAPNLPDGQEVSVTIQSSPQGLNGLRRSFGAWSEDGKAVDEFLEDIRRERKHARTEPLG